MATYLKSQHGAFSSVLGGESFFQNTYQVEDGVGTVGFAPGKPGDIVDYEVNGGELILEKSVYLASESGVRIDANFQGLRGLFNEGLFILRGQAPGSSFSTATGTCSRWTSMDLTSSTTGTRSLGNQPSPTT